MWVVACLGINVTCLRINLPSSDSKILSVKKERPLPLDWILEGRRLPFRTISVLSWSHRRFVCASVSVCICASLWVRVWLVFVYVRMFVYACTCAVCEYTPSPSHTPTPCRCKRWVGWPCSVCWRRALSMCSWYCIPDSIHAVASSLVLTVQYSIDKSPDSAAVEASLWLSYAN